MVDIRQPKRITLTEYWVVLYISYGNPYIEDTVFLTREEAEEWVDEYRAYDTDAERHVRKLTIREEHDLSN